MCFLRFSFFLFSVFLNFYLSSLSSLFVSLDWVFLFGFGVWVLSEGFFFFFWFVCLLLLKLAMAMTEKKLTETLGSGVKYDSGVAKSSLVLQRYDSA